MSTVVDSYFYGRVIHVPFNLVRYNVLGASESAGPDIFGTEPWWYYLANLALNFNIIGLLALLSPVLLVRGCCRTISHWSFPFNLIPIFSTSPLSLGTWISMSSSGKSSNPSVCVCASGIEMRSSFPVVGNLLHATPQGGTVYDPGVSIDRV